MSTVASATPLGPRAGAVAVEPSCWRQEKLAEAVIAGGGSIAALANATALVWADPATPQDLRPALHPGIDWAQLPFAGIEPFIALLDRDRLWTCGKGVYARPVAEHVLTSILSMKRGFVHYARQNAWSGPTGTSLHGANVTIAGGGGITSELLPLLAPFGCHITVVRRSPEPFVGADVTIDLAGLDDVLGRTDVLVLALAVTPETAGLVDRRRLDLLPASAVVVNVARGVHVVTNDLADALAANTIAGAVIDVTDPEPLPAEHRLWTMPNCLITPHIGNTPEMGLELLAERVTENVARYIAGHPLLGPVDLDLGY